MANHSIPVVVTVEGSRLVHAVSEAFRAMADHIKKNRADVKKFDALDFAIMLENLARQIEDRLSTDIERSRAAAPAARAAPDAIDLVLADRDKSELAQFRKQQEAQFQATTRAHVPGSPTVVEAIDWLARKREEAEAEVEKVRTELSLARNLLRDRVQALETERHALCSALEVLHCKVEGSGYGISVSFPRAVLVERARISKGPFMESVAGVAQKD